MRIETVHGTSTGDLDGVRAAIQALELGLGGPADMVFFHGAQDCNPKVITAALLERWPRVKVHGGSSCMGVMTRGWFRPDPRSFGFLGISDPAGAYGVGMAGLQTNPREAAKKALGLALDHAGRPGEMPQMILLTAPPGCEEELLLGIGEVVGPQVPVAGGSAADEAVTGAWWVSANEVVDNRSVIVTTLFPSGGVVSSFQSGYEATEKSGIITHASGHAINEIDGRPAAQLYNEWTGGALADVLEGGGKIAQRISGLHPVGRRAGSSGEIVEYVLSFLDTVQSDGSLTVFTEVREGERLWLMRGTVDNLVERAGRIARVARDALAQERGSDAVAGALVVYCASCLVHIRDRMPEVVAGLDAALGDRPYLGTFTFGEQGCFLAGGNRHGNMMVTVILFTGET
jgi:hypothetical protein